MRLVSGYLNLFAGGLGQIYVKYISALKSTTSVK